MARRPKPTQQPAAPQEAQAAAVSPSDLAPPPAPAEAPLAAQAPGVSVEEDDIQFDDVPVVPDESVLGVLVTSTNLMTPVGQYNLGRNYTVASLKRAGLVEGVHYRTV